METQKEYVKLNNPNRQDLEYLLTMLGEFSLVKTLPVRMVSGDMMFSAKHLLRPVSEMNKWEKVSHFHTHIAAEVHFGTFDLWEHPCELSEDSDLAEGCENSADGLEEESDDTEVSIICVERAYDDPVHINGKYSQGKFTELSMKQTLEKVAQLYKDGYFVVEDLRTILQRYKLRISEVAVDRTPIIVDYYDFFQPEPPLEEMEALKLTQ